MISLLLKNSGFYIEENEHNMFETELLEMIKQLDILTEICESNTDNRECIEYSLLREDIQEMSSPKSDILINSKSKTDIGFIVNKVI